MYIPFVRSASDSLGSVGNPTRNSNEHPYSLQDYIDGADNTIYGVIQWIIGEITGRNTMNESNATVPASTEAGFAHDFEVMEKQQKLHQYNLLNDPILQMQGYENAGISKAAAAQAITGNSSNFAPAGSSVSGGSANMSSNAIPALLQSLIQAPFYSASAKNQEAQADLNSTEADLAPQRSKADIDKIYSDIRENARKNDLDEAHLKLDEKLADVNISKTNKEIDVLVKDVEKIQAEINKYVAETDLLDKYSTHELIKMSYTKQRISESQQNITESKSRVSLNEQHVEESKSKEELLKSQEVGQDIQNEILDVQATMQDFRLQCSKAVGFDVNAPETNMLLQGLLTGNSEHIIHTIRLLKTSSLVGDLQRGFSDKYNPSKQNSTFQPSWRPTKSKHLRGSGVKW